MTKGKLIQSKACTVELCDRKLEAYMFLLDTGGYDVILGMT